MKDLQDIMNKIEAFGFSIFRVGGCVRDILLSRESHDIDLATNATPDQLSSLFHTVDVGGKKFGITVVPTEKDSFEIATFRKDVSSSKNHRHPDAVEFSNIENDAFRRDLTINALFQDSVGNIVDPTKKGIKDVESKLIRFCTEKDDEVQGSIDRINEDPLRVLRAFRFLATLDGFNLSQSAFTALEIVSQNVDIFCDISNERIGQELKKLILGSQAGKALDLMNKLGFLKMILPEVARLQFVPQNIDWHKEGNAFVHTLLVVDACERDTTARMACLLHDIGKTATLAFKNGQPTNHGHDILGAQMAEIICRRLKFSAKETEPITEAIRLHMKIKDVASLKKLDAWTILQSKFIKTILSVAVADEKGKITDKKFTTLNDQLSLPEIAFMLNNRIPEPLVTGKDLINLGLKPDPTFKRKLNVAFRNQVNKNWTKAMLLNQIVGW